MSQFELRHYPLVWDKPGTTAAEFEADRNACAFEVLKATQTPDTSFRTVVGQELDLSMRRRELAIACMRAKGYSQR